MNVHFLGKFLPVGIMALPILIQVNNLQQVFFSQFYQKKIDVNGNGKQKKHSKNY